MHALGSIGSTKVLDPLSNILRMEGSPLRDDAFSAVMDIYKKISGGEEFSIKERLHGKFGEQSFRAYLIGLLNGTDHNLKEDALIIAGVLKDEASSGKALELLQDEFLSAAALDTLREIGIKALPEARKHLKNPSGRVRKALVDYLESLGEGPGVEELIGMLHDDMNMVRAEAALALGRIGAADAASPLADALEDESLEVQEAAVAALSAFPPALVCSNILPYLQRGGHPRYMSLAAETLGLLKAEEAIRPLSSLLYDSREAIREVAIKSIGRIGGEKAVPFLIMALQDQSPKVAQQAVISMGKVKDPHILQRLIKFVREKDDALCFYAIGALKEQDSPFAIFSLMEILKDSPREMTVAALEALGSLGMKETCKSVLETSQTDDIELLRVCLQTLGRLGCEVAAPRLIELLSHRHWSVRAAAAEALGNIGGEEVCEALQPVLKDEDGMVRKIAAAALGKIG
jgi:HEAT repeat protein